jgi:putative transposase
LRLTFKYRLYPTEAQAQFLDSQLSEACDLYNAALQERRDAWKICRKNISLYDQVKQLKPMRAEGLIGIVNFGCARGVLQRLDWGFQRFFARVKRGEKPGYPRFKSRRRYNSITFPNYGNGCTLLKNGKLRMQGAGQIKLKLHRPVEGTIKTATIKRDAGYWYVCFNAICESKPLPASSEAIGIDIGLTSFATLSNATIIANPRHNQKAQAKLRKAQRRVARRKKGSNRRRKAVQQLQRHYLHVHYRREDFHHKIARELVNRYGMIAIEDLGIARLAKTMMAKSIYEVGWAGFFQKLDYKAANAGRRVIKVDPRGTSQLCICGTRVSKTLKDRWHDCSVCGLSANRDHVSARVILQRAWDVPSGVNVEVLDSCVS